MEIIAVYSPYYSDNFYYSDGSSSSNQSTTSSNSFFDADKNRFFNSKAVLKIINGLIDIGIYGNDMYIITEVMFANRIKKFHHFFNNMGIANVVKTTKLMLPYSYKLVDIYQAHIGDRFLSPPVQIFFSFLFMLYNYKYFDIRKFESLFYNHTLNSIYAFSQLYSKCKKNDLCKIAMKKIDFDSYFQSYFQNVSMLMSNNYNHPYYYPIQAPFNTMSYIPINPSDENINYSNENSNSTSTPSTPSSDACDNNDDSNSTSTSSTPSCDDISNSNSTPYTPSCNACENNDDSNSISTASTPSCDASDACDASDYNDNNETEISRSIDYNVRNSKINQLQVSTAVDNETNFEQSNS